MRAIKKEFVRRDQKETQRKELLFTRNVILAGIFVMSISLLPLYKRYALPDVSELKLVNGLVKNKAYHKTTKGGRYLILSIKDIPEIEFEVSDLALELSEYNIPDAIEIDDSVSLGIKSLNGVADPFLPVTIYSLRTSKLVLFQAKDYLEKTAFNCMKAAFVINTFGVLIIILGSIARIKIRRNHQRLNSLHKQIS